MTDPFDAMHDIIAKQREQIGSLTDQLAAEQHALANERQVNADLSDVAARRLGLLGTAYRKLQYLLRMYPGDKETAAWCEAVEVETFGPRDDRSIQP